MSTQAGMSPTEDRPSLATGIALRVGTVAFFLIMEAVILFAALDWVASRLAEAKPARAEPVES
ncbi:MAG: hypothetical protein ABSE70_12010 [Candidatus Limnocylindrales bacterium]